MDCKGQAVGSATIYVGSNSMPVKTYCTGDGWTVIQSRGQFGNPKDYFSIKKWEEYKNGFGEPGNLKLTH